MRVEHLTEDMNEYSLPKLNTCLCEIRSLFVSNLLKFNDNEPDVLILASSHCIDAITDMVMHAIDA